VLLAAHVSFATSIGDSELADLVSTVLLFASGRPLAAVLAADE
jgi:hypothetical protein